MNKTNLDNEIIITTLNDNKPVKSIREDCNHCPIILIFTDHERMSLCKYSMWVKNDWNQMILKCTCEDRNENNCLLAKYGNDILKVD